MAVTYSARMRVRASSGESQVVAVDVDGEAGKRKMLSVSRFSACGVENEEWIVVDQARNDAVVAPCSDGDGAELIAGLMNGDLAALASASAETLARCRNVIGGLLRVLTPRGLPSVGTGAFPQI